MSRVAKIIFFGLIVKPLVFIALGLRVYNHHHLPKVGPAILVPNHNSHLDTLVLISLYPLSKIHFIRPVAAADYFLSNPILAWFSLKILDIIPIERYNIQRKCVFEACEKALEKNEILIIFPEGSRGYPEKLSTFKKGIYHLLKNKPNVPLIPIVIQGLGRVLPKGEALFVPFNCELAIGEAFYSNGYELTHFMEKIMKAFEELFNRLDEREK